ncbi:Tricarboxylate transport protein [Colletotrichum siamense]|uniref:Tricarboxylate transport protein n=1 Tax=Colletotrichum siamense TaxID=690259 RepID=UPI00187219AA|nr:Tricarboxylate transport protein [Colletotrichum siamense]KAF5487177.1 Tricarboxylate transport protein [Colletotrichum siamense]
MTALTTPQSPGMGMSTSNNTSVKQPVLNTPSAGKKHQISPGVSLISGGIAGGVEAATTYPFEFAKTRAQLYTTTSKNPFAVITQVAKQDGLRAIYTGCSTLIIGTTFKAGVRFLSFDSIRNALMDEKGKLTPARGILAGMIAGCVESVVAVTPTERVKTAL